MANRTDELKEEIDQNREDIGYTVDQIQNRVSPGRVAARGRYRMRRWWIDSKDRIMGNDMSEYPWEKSMEGMSERVGAMTDKATDLASGVKEGIANTPAELRRQTQGNPIAAGVIAFGGGLLLGSLLPETRTERTAVQRLEPGVAAIAQEASEVGKSVAEDLRTNAADAIEEVKDSASAAAEGVRDEAKEAMTRTREGAQT